MRKFRDRVCVLGSMLAALASGCGSDAGNGVVDGDGVDAMGGVSDATGGVDATSGSDAASGVDATRGSDDACRDGSCDAGADVADGGGAPSDGGRPECTMGAPCPRG